MPYILNGGWMYDHPLPHLQKLRTLHSRQLSRRADRRTPQMSDLRLCRMGHHLRPAVSLPQPRAGNHVQKNPLHCQMVRRK